MTVYEAAEARRSVRKYRGTPIPRPTLQKIVECGPKAPSGMNDQGWVFVIVDDITMKNAVAAASPYGGHIADAGACVAIFCRKDVCTPVEDCCAAAENIILAATAEGLGTCWINSYRKENAKVIQSLLGCPDTHELVVLMALGVPAEVPPSPNKKPMEEVIHWNEF